MSKIGLSVTDSAVISALVRLKQEDCGSFEAKPGLYGETLSPAR